MDLLPAPEDALDKRLLERCTYAGRAGRPAYLFVAFAGGKYDTSSGAVFRVRESVRR